VAAILPSLRHPDSATRRWAIEALRFFGAHAGVVVPALLASLASEPEARNRLATVKTLGELRWNSAPVAQALAAVLVGDTSRDVCSAAAEVIERAGAAAAEAVPALLAAFSDTRLDARARIVIARVLCTIDPETVAQTIGGLEAIRTDAEDDSARLEAADLLEQIE
jgi:hypothetical protein